MGSLVGRYANRISNGRVTIDQKHYQLSLNDGINHLHGGYAGFHTKIWTVGNYKNDHDQCWIELSLTSPHGEEGYPGSLTVIARFTLARFNELRLLLRAKTTEASPINLTAHPYFNLSGFTEETILWPLP